MVQVPGDKPGEIKLEQKKSGIKFKKSAFIKDATNTRGVVEKPLERSTRDAKWGRDERLTRSDEVEFSQGLKDQYASFLATYTKDLLVLKEQKPAVYQAILSTSAHAMDKRLAELLGMDLKNLSGGRYDEKESAGKIDAMLQTAEGWAITTQLWERHIALKLFGIGVHAAALFSSGSPRDRLAEGERQVLLEDRRGIRMENKYTIRRGIDQGVWNRFQQEHLEEIGINPLILAAVSGLSADAGAAITNTIQGLVGGAAIPPAIYGVYRAVESYRRDGLMFDIRACSAGLDMIKNDPNEKAYLKEIMGISVDDFVVTGANQIRLVREDEGVIRTIKHASDDLMVEALGGIYARHEFYTSLGIPLKRLDALPEQYLYRATNLQPEQTGTRWQADVQDEFEALGGVRDAANVALGTLGFNIANLDFEGNLRRYNEARNMVISRYIDRFIRRESEKANPLNPIDAIDKKLKFLDSDEGKKARTGEWNRQRTTLEGDQTTINGDKTAVDTYKTALDVLQEARKDLDKALAKISVAGVAGTPDLEAAIKGLEDLVQPGTSVHIDGKLITSFTDEESRLFGLVNADLGLIPAGLTQKQYETRVQMIESKFKPEFAKLEANKKLVEKHLASLNELSEKIDNQEKGLGETSDPVKGVKKVDSFSKDRETVVGYAAAGVVASLTDADLAGGLNFDQIMERINQINAAAPTQGWAREQNSRADLRERVLNAIFEAQARTANPGAFVFPAPPPGGVPTAFERLTDPTGTLKISENQLRTLTEKEIEALVNRRGGGVSLAEIQGAIPIANERFEARATAVSNRADQIGEQIKNLDAQIKGVNFDQEKAALNATKDLLQNYGNIRTKALDIDANRDAFTNVTLVTNADTTYTLAERTLTAPRGYYEFMNLLFSYRSNSSRSEYFRTVQTLLSPDKMAGLLNGSLGLGIAAPTMPAVLPEIQNRMNTLQITPDLMSLAIEDIFDQLRDEGLAMAA